MNLETSHDILMSRICSKRENADLARLERAYDMGLRLHKDQKRKSGEPYFIHPIAVAGILADLGLDDDCLIAALLHDTLEDTNVSIDEISAAFGDQVAELVEGCTKIAKIDRVGGLKLEETSTSKTREVESGENLRKLLIAMSGDIRVLLIKLADRLHNMRTIEHQGNEAKKRISKSTLDIYVPLASRVGIHSWREELEDICFRTAFTESYSAIAEHLEGMQHKYGDVINQYIQKFQHALQESNIDANVTGREKRPYSIWRKMTARRLELREIRDIHAFRILINSEEDCYRALGAIHRRWRYSIGRFKDFISIPKENGYQSLHTTIDAARGQKIEVQIRTYDMNNTAEYGIAAHYFYKEKGDNIPEHIAKLEASASKWLRESIDFAGKGSSPKEFEEFAKMSLYTNEVFVYSPENDLYILPRGSSAIDFAYAVHTSLGNHCLGCSINGQVVPLTTKLRNGDTVEIRKNEQQNHLPESYEKYLVTSKARSAFRAAVKNANMERSAKFGEQIIRSAFERENIELDRERIKGALIRLSKKNVREVFVAVGLGQITSEEVKQALYPDYQQLRPQNTPNVARLQDVEGPRWFPISGFVGMLFRFTERPSSGKVTRKSITQLKARFADGIGAVPGDRCVAIFEPGEGITVFPINSKALATYENSEAIWLDATWDTENMNNARFPCRIVVISFNAPGSLAQLTQTVADHDGNIENLVMRVRSADYHEITFDLAVWSLRHLMDIIGQLQVKKIVHSVVRYLG